MRHWGKPLRLALGLACILTTMLGMTEATAQTPEILVELARNEVFLGETVRYTVLLNHFDTAATPQLTTTDDFELTQTGKRLANEVRSTTVNFETRTISRQGPLITYDLVPKRAGVLSIPGPTAEVDGKRLQGESLTLRVVEPQAQDLARLHVSVDPAEVYPTQPFRVTLSLSIHGLPEPASDRDPLTVQDSMPTLTIPWATDDDELPSGVAPVEPRDRWAQRFLRTDRGRIRGGVSINGFTQRSSDLITGFFGSDPFDVFGSGRRRDSRMPFHPTPTRAEAEDLRGVRVPYWTYRFDRQFMAKEPGVYQLGSATLKGLFAKRMRARNQLDGEAVFTLADPATIVVRSPPEEGRPAEYVGAIGRFECGAHITPTQAKVGDPMTLSIWLRGSGILSTAKAPDLQRHPQISELFKVYDATGDLQNDTQTFTYGLRPQREGIAEVPSIAVAYFDADREEYVTLRTDALPVQIGTAERLRQDEIAVAAGSPRNQAADIETSTEGIFANVTDMRQLQDETVRPERWFLGLGCMAGAFLAFVVARQSLDRRNGDPHAKQRRTAAARARQKVAQARREIEHAEPAAAADQLSRAFVQLVADCTGVAESSLTTSDAVARLIELQVDGELVQRCRSVLDGCDAIRYGSSSSGADRFIDEAEATCGALVAALRKQKRLP